MTKISELATAIGQARLNPSLVQDQVYEAIESATNGELDIVDPSTPFNLLQGTGVALYLAGMNAIETATRQQYPQLAQTYDDLYHHMANVDYLDRFCTPAKTEFEFAVSREELIQRMVDVPNTRIKQITLPRNTSWTVNDYVFTTLYPVVARLMPYGGIEITYDNSIESPIGTLDTNLVEWYASTQNNVDYITMVIPVMQFKITSTTVPIAPGTTVAQKFTLADQYFYCRVWRKISDGTWLEVETTHSKQVQDPNTPTAVLQVNENSLTVTIPQIYITTKQISNEMRIDIYTSRGVINLDLSGFAPSNYVMAFNDPEETVEESRYSAPYGAFNDMYFYCTQKVNGGANGLTFEQLRERVIHNANHTDNPITDAQLKTTVERAGFNVLKSIDDINSRTYLATRAMPAPTTGKFTTGLGCSMELFQATIESLVGYSTVEDNGERITIKPDTLFVIRDGNISIVSDAEKKMMYSMSSDVLANQVNNVQYLWTPFHYVLDTSNNRFSTRAYYMENPRIKYREFIERNETTLLGVAPDSMTLTKTATGFSLVVSTSSGDSWKALRDDQCHLQLAFQPEDDTGWAFMNGVQENNLLNGERVYRFDIETDWDVTTLHSLIVKNFSMFNNASREIAMPLSGTWDLVYAVSDYDVYQLEPRSLDSWMGNMLLPSNSHGISRNRIGVTTGDSLDGLWSRARPVAGSERYATWDADVLAFYDTDIPKRENGKPVVEVKDGKVTYVYEHRAGDPVIDTETGKQKISFVAGSAKLDSDGKPIRLLDRKTERQFDILMLDGIYYFATDPEDVEYAKYVPSTLVDWITGPIADIGGKLIENTFIRFYPTRSLGYSRIVINDGREISIPAGMQFHVTYVMSLVSYTNTELRTALSQNASDIINSVLSRNTVSVSDIISRITAAAGTDVIGVKLDDLGPNKDISTYTAIDESTRCSVKRKLVVLPDGILRVQEDIAFDFVNHKLQTIDRA